MTGHGCTACNFTGVVTFDGKPSISRANTRPCHGCSPWVRPEKGGPPSTEEFASAAYPALRLMLMALYPDAAREMPEDFASLPDKDRERFVELMQRQLIDQFNSPTETP